VVGVSPARTERSKSWNQKAGTATRLPEALTNTARTSTSAGSNGLEYSASISNAISYLACEATEAGATPRSAMRLGESLAFARALAASPRNASTMILKRCLRKTRPVERWAQVSGRLKRLHDLSIAHAHGSSKGRPGTAGPAFRNEGNTAACHDSVPDPPGCAGVPRPP